MIPLTDDPIASDPALLWTWTRIIIALVTLLAISVGASSTDTIDLDRLLLP
jgi:hypothetical protein